MHYHLEAKLHADVEGTCSGEYGYIIAVLDVVDVGIGLVSVGTGQAEFITTYRAIVFKPFKGEVLDGVVLSVNKASPRLYVRKFRLLNLFPDGLLR